nr:uncharacterized protein LOC131776689 [Pocillopora verrucosa]XP_058948899.1 uncharacterized protein LOC131776689 [Pocillopora verrucosa]
MLFKLKLILMVTTSQFYLTVAGCNIPLIQNLPKRRFSATSLKEDAFNLRFTPGTPWCPAERPPLEADYAKEYVLVDLGCPRSICTVESKDENLMTYSGEYSIDKKNWKKLSTNDTTHYYMEEFDANYKALITPPVTARFFRFHLLMCFWSEEKKSRPCGKVELYSDAGLDPDDSTEPMGCFIEQTSKKDRLLPVVYHTVGGKIVKKLPDILAIYKECRQNAEDHVEIFGILNFKHCVTTQSGKEEGYFNSARKSRKCNSCYGKGIGTGKKAVFVYKINL